MSKCYICYRENDLLYGYLSVNIMGIDFKPKNNIDYDGIVVSRLVVIDPDMIENILKKKTKRKLNAYLSFLINILDDDADDGDMALILEDAKKYERTIKMKYAPYLSPSYIKVLLVRVKFIEDELKARIKENNITMSNTNSKGR